MRRVVGLLVAMSCGIGCGDNPRPPPLTQEALLDKLRALPEVTVEVATFPADATEVGYEVHYYILQFTQPVDHDDPSQGTFQQQVRLLHRDDRAAVPLVAYTAGYADKWGYKPVELTRLLAANQISIEHRFFGASRPATIDWSRLTIAQMAADEHAIITALRTIYDGAVLTTGGSKGGMAAMFHRRFYPDDADATVAYVTPLSSGPSDVHYQSVLDGRNVTPCRQAVRAAAVSMLASHRDELVAKARAKTEDSYTRVTVEAAVEAAVASLEWGFWQHDGAPLCGSVPAADASVDDLFSFLDTVSPVSEYADETLGAYEAYVYQAHTQLGYPAEEPSYLTSMGLLQFDDDDYVGELPLDVIGSDDDRGHGNKARGPGRGGSDDEVALPFDAAAMPDVGGYFAQHGERLLLVYGEDDPWSARPFTPGGATDSAVLTQPAGTHYSQLRSLAEADRAQAFALLSAWTGVALSQIETAAQGATEDASRESRGLPPRGFALRPGK